MGDKSKTDTSLNPKQRSRREFLENAGTTAAVATAVPVLGISAAQAQSDTQSTASKTTIQLTVNGSRHSVDVEDRWTLVEVLRDQLDLTGTKIGCDRSECGACTVIMNGNPVYSCSQLAVWADGAQVTTVEGLASGGQLSPVQQAFVENNGPQCGFCTPGQLMTATALLSNNATPNADEVKQALVGNLCRCSNYNAIVEAVVMAGERSGGAA
jgi:aerobic-type carbon monoxide dehydrogenase small subunit (CoxS/CutS family)|tara:strand:+ start:3442 stop:4077 length:636 start_codon:yes stop_codon:yes gene_type:complete